MKFKAVIFDWDGTLVDSVEHIAESLHHAAQALGYPILERQAYRDIIGLGMIEALEILYPGVSSEERVAIRERYAEYFFTRVTTPQNVFAGMADVVVDIRRAGWGCSVATGKSRRGLGKALETSGLGQHFDITRCADETRSKPDPTMLEEIIRFYGIEPKEAVMIGDTRYDLEMAQRIGMPSIGVEWGVHQRNILEEYAPYAIVDTVPDLRRVLGL